MNWLFQFEMLGFGLLGGILGGLLGIGGGIVYVIVLPGVLLQLGVYPDEIVAFTVANSLFATFFTSLTGNISQVRNRNFHPKPVLIISFFGIVTSILLLQFFVNSLYFSTRLFNWLFLVFLSFMLVRLILKVLHTSEKGQDPKMENSSVIAMVFSGIGAGMVSPLTGLGGGIFIVPLLHTLLNYPMKKANSISMGVIGITAFSSSVFNMFWHPLSEDVDYQCGLIVLPVVATLSSAGMVGSIIGVKINSKLKPSLISILFAAFLLIVIVKKLFQIL